MPITTEDYATVLFVLDNGAHGAFTVCQVAAGRKNRLFYEIDGGKCALAWDQERPNELWVGFREKPNELVIKDPSLLKEAARPYAHYPGGHPEGYPDGPEEPVPQRLPDGGRRSAGPAVSPPSRTGIGKWRSARRSWRATGRGRGRRWLLRKKAIHH